jgi:glutathione peroxidase
MRKILFILGLVLFTLPGLSQTKSFYSFKVEDVNGNEFDLSSFKGKKVLVVNTASKCGLTPQYEDLQKLYEDYSDKGFVVIAFPANNFMNQEPGTNAEILEFCTDKYEVTFPIMAKISVKGDDIHPLYQWLTSKSENGVEDSSVSWNFQKYLIDENGKLVKHLAPKKNPFDQEIIDFIKG